MSDLRELYQQVILDHNKNPKNWRRLEDANCHAEGFNPLCGDQLELFVKVEDGKINAIGFQGTGCAISKSSASLMTMSVQGKSLLEINHLFENFHQMLTGKPGGPIPEGLGSLEVFSGVCEFPARVKCATLAWHTLKSALEGKEKPVSTE